MKFTDNPVHPWKSSTLELDYGHGAVKDKLFITIHDFSLIETFGEYIPFNEVDDEDLTACVEVSKENAKKMIEILQKYVGE